MARHAVLNFTVNAVNLHVNHELTPISQKRLITGSLISFIVDGHFHIRCAQTTTTKNQSYKQPSISIFNASFPKCKINKIVLFVVNKISLQCQITMNKQQNNITPFK